MAAPPLPKLRISKAEDKCQELCFVCQGNVNLSAFGMD
jgi:hypothetical protein